MSNPIRNVNQLSTLTSLSAYDVKEGGLHQISDLHKAARQIADMFRNMTSSGQLHIATRNAQVSTQIHKLIQNEANNIANGDAENQGLTIQNIKRHNLNGLHALKDQVKNSDISRETKEILLFNIQTFENKFKNPTNLDDALNQSKGLLSFKNYIFKKVDTGYDDTVNNALKTFIIDYRNSSTLPEQTIFEQLALDLYREGIDLFMNQILSPEGINGAIKNGTYGHNCAQRLRQEYENRSLSENNDDEISSRVPEQVTFYKEMMKDLFAAGNPADSDKSFKAYAPFFASIMNQSGISRYVVANLCNDLGLWSTGDFASLGIIPNITKTFCEVKNSPQGYDIEIRGDAYLRAVDTSYNAVMLGDSKFSVELHIPKGQIRPEDENPPRITNETFIPEFTVSNIKFSHSIE